MSRTSRVRRQVRRLVKRWCKPLGLLWWDIHFHYLDERKQYKSGTELAMETFSDWRYLEANVYVYVPTVADLDKTQVEEVFVHEMMHIFVNEMREKGLHHEERVCRTLERAFLRSRK